MGPDLPLRAQQAPACSLQHCHWPTPLRYWAGKFRGGGRWGDVLNAAEPEGASEGGGAWGWRRSCLPMVVFCAPHRFSLLLIIVPFSSEHPPWSTEVGRGRVNAALLERGRKDPASCSQNAWNAPACPKHCAGERGSGRVHRVWVSPTPRTPPPTANAVSKGIWRQQQLLT